MSQASLLLSLLSVIPGGGMIAICAVTVATLLALTLILRQTGTAPIERGMRKFAALLLGRGLFRTLPSAERTKLDLVRIVLGLIFLYRAVLTSAFAMVGPDTTMATVVCATQILLLVAFTLGVMTPLVSFILLVGGAALLDGYLRTQSLGSDVFAMTLLIFTFAPAGTRISLDALIVERNWPGAAAVRGLYRLVGPPTLTRLVLIKWATLFAYGLLCLYSVLLHLQEPGWLSGDVGVTVLASSFMSTPWRLFRSLFEHSNIAVAMARLSMQGMLVWYFCFLPGVVIGGWVRRVVVGWALMFFLVSTFVLQLGMLGYAEMALLALLFWNRAFMRRSRIGLDVLYDDRCNLCGRTVRLLRQADVFQVLRLRPLSANQALLQQWGVSPDAALLDLVGYDSRRRRTVSGYRLYMELTLRLPLLFIFAPVLWLGKLTRLGPTVYRLIADRRRRWFGVCALDSGAGRSPPRTPALASLGGRGQISSALFTAFAIQHAAFGAIYISQLPRSALPEAPRLQQMVRVYAYAPINVFNDTDLRMMQHWFTLTAIDSNGQRQLAPLTGAEGQRLAWQRSDRVYFGDKLRWRRMRNDYEAQCYLPVDAPFLEEEASWVRRHAKSKPVAYELDYYHQPRITPEEGAVQVSPPVKICTIRLDEQGRFVGSIS
jgi:predicted DCC family thiol-disulfide oxidoreductase YuxK